MQARSLFFASSKKKKKKKDAINFPRDLNKCLLIELKRTYFSPFTLHDYFKKEITLFPWEVRKKSQGVREGGRERGR